jgi:hypothetical protein
LTKEAADRERQQLADAEALAAQKAKPAKRAKRAKFVAEAKAEL